MSRRSSNPVVNIFFSFSAPDTEPDSLSEREEIVSTLMYLIKLVKSTVLNVLTYLKVEQYTTKEMKCKEDYLSRLALRGRVMGVTREATGTSFFSFIAKNTKINLISEILLILYN